MLQTFRQALQLLDNTDRFRVYQLLALSIITAVIEVMGIGSVAPFIAVLSNPDLVNTNEYLNRAYVKFNLPSPYAFLSLLASVFVGLLLLRNVLFMFYQWLNFRYLAIFKHNLSSQLLAIYLAQPYAHYLSHSTIEMQRNVVEEANRVIDGVLRPIISALTQLIICTAIVIFLVLIRPVVALVTLSVLGGFYSVVYFIVNKRVSALGKKRREYRSRKFKLANEALSGVKALLLSGKQRGYIDDYEETSLKNAKAEAKGQIIGTVPRYGIESIAIVGLISFMVLDMRSSQNGIVALPLMSMYLLAGYRLLPALQGLYSGLSRIKFDRASYIAIQRDIATLETPTSTSATDSNFRFREKIELRSVTYTYRDSDVPVLRNISLIINAKQAVAFVGESGAGKSTLVDLILGMLDPDSGDILIDGEEISAVRRSWQARIGYVPQHIYLADDTVARNIAFGVEPSSINTDLVVRAAKIANVHDYINEQLALGYDTVIGERGTRLSGGQRQRIGIARAMYHKPSILVLDEATSALDGVTENIVLEAIQRLSDDVTVILIAHRITTVQSCDRIFVLADGKIVGQGNFADLSAHSDAFQALSKQPGHSTDASPEPGQKTSNQLSG